jgi:hypothetical protein
MDTLLALSVALYVVNASFLAILASVYGRTALSTRAKYPLGLFVFSLLLFVHSAGTAAAYFFLGGYFDPEVAPYMSVMGSFELVGILALLRITI